jgi:putative ABC transport system permease protein
MNNLGILRTLRLLGSTTRLALGALRRNPLRSLLTALGILIGVAAVTIVVALGEAANRQVAGRIDSLGDNALIVLPRWDVRSAARRARSPELTEADVEVLEREVTGIAAIAPLLETSSLVSWRDANTSTQITGTTLAYFRARSWELGDGVLWPPASESLGERVCVIGATLKSELFGVEEAVGRTIRVGMQPFRVLGVLREKGQTPFGQDQDKTLLMPIRTLRSKLMQTRPGVISHMLLSAEPNRSAARVKHDVTAALRQAHLLVEGAENDFEIRTQEELREVQSKILGMLATLLSAIAAVSMVVGGIGVMNIMLVSVAERTREIGIRMAIGAREIDIMLQFLTEAIVLSVLGGALGALVAALAAVGISRATSWEVTISPSALTAALVVSMAIGIVFGFVPARRAARSDPVQALGRE